jgi:hypothetical protein
MIPSSLATHLRAGHGESALASDAPTHKGEIQACRLKSIRSQESTSARKIGASAAAAGFPANVNVVAALSLAGIGPDKTMIDIWADPAMTRTSVPAGINSNAAMTSKSPSSPQNPLLFRLFIAQPRCDAPSECPLSHHVDAAPGNSRGGIIVVINAV